MHGRTLLRAAREDSRARRGLFAEPQSVEPEGSGDTLGSHESTWIADRRFLPRRVRRSSSCDPDSGDPALSAHRLIVGAAGAGAGRTTRARSSLDPPSIALPEPAACVLTTSSWRGAKDTSELRFREGGPVFAHVSGGKASLHFPVGAANEGAGLEVTDSALALRGHLASDEIWLHAAKAMALGGAVIPLSHARLGWTAARSGAVAVTFDPHEGIELVQPPIAEDVPCDALSLDAGWIESSAALPASKPGKTLLLRAGVAVLLSLTAGGAPLAKLTAKAGVDSFVTVLETAGKDTRVSWRRRDSVIFGWVPSSQLEVPKGGFVGSDSGSAGGSISCGTIPAVSRVTCPEDVPFVVEAGGERMTVGKILAGVTIDVMDATGDYRHFLVRAAKLQLTGDALVRAVRLKDCPVLQP